MDINGKTYNEIKESVKKEIETQKPIALPGGSWCWFCNREICMHMNHGNRIYLHLAMNKLMKDLADERIKNEKANNQV